jgi:hypothetical protein
MGSCFLYSQWNVQSKYEHNFILNKNNTLINHGNKYGFKGEYIFPKNLILSMGFNFAVVNREFTRSSTKYGVQELYYNGRYQMFEFMAIGIGYQFRIKEKLFFVPKLRYNPYFLLKTETFSASKTEFIYSSESDNTETSDPIITSTTMYDNEIDPLMIEYRENNKLVFFPIIPYLSVDMRYSISRRIQGAITFGFSLDNRAVRSHYYNLGASLVFKLMPNDE